MLVYLVIIVLLLLLLIAITIMIIVIIILIIIITIIIVIIIGIKMFVKYIIVLLLVVFSLFFSTNFWLWFFAFVSFLDVFYYLDLFISFWLGNNQIYSMWTFVAIVWPFSASISSMFLRKKKGIIR